jgi:uncharacterized protein
MVAVLAMALLLATAMPARGEAPRSAHDIMVRSDEATRVHGAVSEIAVTLTGADGREQRRKALLATRVQADGIRMRHMVRLLAPDEVRDTAVLITEQATGSPQVKVYLSALHQARTPASHHGKGSLLGADVSHGDIAGHKAQDWTHTLVRTEQAQGAVTYMIESVPKTAQIATDAGYGRRISWINRESLVALRVEYFDVAGQLLKVVDNTRVKRVDPRRRKWLPMTVKVANKQTGHTTFLRVEKFGIHRSSLDHAFMVPPVPVPVAQRGQMPAAHVSSR